MTALCQRRLFDRDNDAYNHWRADDDKPVRRESVPCSCGLCPVEPVVHAGLVETAEALYPDGYGMNLAGQRVRS